MLVAFNQRQGAIASRPNTVVLGATAYWRMFVITSNDVDFQNNYSGLSEVNFRTQKGVQFTMLGTASAKSTFSGSYLPSNAVDGNASTGWFSAAGNATNCWWQFTFNTPALIVEAALQSYPSAAGGQQMIRDGYIQRSEDNVNWTNVIPIVNQRNWSASGETRIFSVS